MKNLKKTLTIGAMVLAVSVTSATAFAASTYNTSAEAAAGLTGKTVESVMNEKAETGKTYGTIAKEAGKLDEFKLEKIEIKKDILAKKVEAGSITQDKADKIIAAIENRQKDCDGTGSEKIGQKLGAGFGAMKGKGNGAGRGLRGNGICNGNVSQTE